MLLGSGSPSCFPFTLTVPFMPFSVNFTDGRNDDRNQNAQIGVSPNAICGRLLGIQK